MAVSWRDKYLQALAEQESAEKRSLSQIHKLRTCLRALGEVAKGVDPELDELLESLTDSKPTRVVNSDHITQAAHKVSGRKPTRAAVSLDALVELVDNLLALNPGGSTQSQLKKYKKLLKVRTKNQHAYPQLLREISDLHKQVLEQIIAKKPGWLARLLGDSARIKQPTAEAEKTARLSEDDELDSGYEETGYEKTRQSPNLEEDIIEADYLVLDEQADAEPHTDAIAQIDSADFKDGGVVEPTAAAKPEADKEPTFTSISDKITSILQEMLDGVMVDDCVKQKFVDAKSRIDAGLNWYEMVATLEDIRDLFLQAYLVTNENFTQYLKEVETALEHIKEHWLILTQNKQKQLETQTQVKNQLSDYKTKMLVDMDNTSEVDALKSSVAGHLEDLAGTIVLIEEIESQNRQYDEELNQLQQQFDQLQASYALIQEELAKQKHKALHDHLTGLPNRDAYNQKIHEELIRWRRYHRPLCVAVVDVDHFKQFNDNYGHQTGDRVLKIIGKILRQRLRAVDFIARFGGEEFVIILPETNAADAKEVLDSIRQALAKAPFKFKDDPVSITASFGLTEFVKDDSSESAFARADQALYKSKGDGRNRVTILP